MLLRLPATVAQSLMPAERIMLSVTAALALAALAILTVRGIPVDWLAYMPVFGGGTAMLAIGLYYRLSGRSDIFAATLIATGAYIDFAAVASAFNHLLLPIWRAPIDPTLAAIDAAVGVHWPDVLALAAKSPLLVEATRYAYMSSLYQFLVIVLVLGLGGRTQDLQTFMLATVLCCLATVGFWALFPSLGTTSIHALAPELEAQVRPILGTRYGQDMLRVAAEGPALLTPKEMRGLISAPSFHTVMALLAVHAVRGIRWLFVPFVLLNALVLPGTIIHGAHHLVDVVFGAALTVAGIALASRLLATPAGQPRAEIGASAR